MKNARVKILFFLLSLWIFLAVLSVFYNLVKSVSEFKEWTPLSDNEKRLKLFGDSYSFAAFIEEKTEENGQILLFSNDGMVYYYSRYYLYPQIIYWATEEKTFKKLIKTKKFKYLAVYDKIIPFGSYKKIASYSSKKSSKNGVLYKL